MHRCRSRVSLLNTRGLLARVNFLRDEPGGRRFFVNDLNGPLYILDKQTKRFTTYLDFNGLGERPGLFRKLTFERNTRVMQVARGGSWAKLDYEASARHRRS